MTLTCEECKNAVDLSAYPELAVGHVIECGTCGITLEITAIDGSNVSAEVADEGK